MKPTFCFYHLFSNEPSPPLYVEAEQGFNWSVFFVPFAFGLIKHCSTRRLGIYVFLFELLYFFFAMLLIRGFGIMSVVLRSFIPFAVALLFCVFILIIYRTLLAFFFNKLHVRSLLKKGYQPYDMYTIDFLQKNLAYVPKKSIDVIMSATPFNSGIEKKPIET